jgi:predicted  nucleic acid-binding Zn-ribbon protein
MRKAKCTLCGDIIENNSETEWKGCKCGVLHVKGNRLRFDSLENVLMIDPNGSEISLKPKDIQREQTEEMQSAKPTKEEMLEMLDDMARRIDDLPGHAASQPITHYDFQALVLLLSSILRAS